LAAPQPIIGHEVLDGSAARRPIGLLRVETCQAEAFEQAGLAGVYRP
jgi:hypothetical protein